MAKSVYEANVRRDDAAGERSSGGTPLGWRGWLRLILGLGLMTFVVTEIVMNGQRVQLNVTWWTWHTELWSALVAACGLGLLIGLLVPAALRHARSLRRSN